MIIKIDNKQGDSDAECDIDDEEGVQKGNSKHYWKGSDIRMTETRKDFLKQLYYF